MQSGGKLKDGESHLTALECELREELRCSSGLVSPVLLGTFTAAAAK
jgi:hypothetical protein